MVKAVIREIKSSFGRYLAILAIIALGTGFLCGLMLTRPAMLHTLGTYLDETSFYDFRLVSTIGYEQASVGKMARLDCAAAAEGVFEKDALFTLPGGEDKVFKAYSMTESTNRLELNAGRFPERPNECVADWLAFGENDIGKTLRLSEANDGDTLGDFAYSEYTIVGVAMSPEYINYERGSTSLGTGTVAGYLYMPYDGFDVDYFTSIYLRLNETAAPYSDEYAAIADAAEPAVKALAEQCTQDRYDSIVSEAQQKIDDARAELEDAKKEYDDGVEEYRTERADAEKELDDAYYELIDGERKIKDGWNDYHQGRADLADETEKAQKELEDAEKELSDAHIELLDGEDEYADGLEQYKDGRRQLEDAEAELEDAREQLSDALEQLMDAKRQLSAAESELSAQQAQFDSSLESVTDGVNAYLAMMTGQPGDYTPDEVLYALRSGDAQLTAMVDAILAPAGSSAAELVYGDEQLRQGWAEYYDGYAEYEAGYEEYEAGYDEYADGAEKLESSRQELDDAKSELRDAREKLDDGWAEYYDGLRQLEDGRQELADETAKAERELSDAYDELKDGESDLKTGWGDYYDGRAEADSKFADAERELADGEVKIHDAELQLDDAQAELDDLDEPETYVLDRGTNIGYVCFESDSNIVAGVARVFPVFFFLVAALVCITTMTRMVDEQRTQIGVYKALGFSNGAIMSKYLLYSGSASLLGCAIGFAVGSTVFPYFIWQGYSIMYGFTTLEYYFDPALAAVTTAAYLAVSSLAAYRACRSELRSVPAELIRPKTPKAGRRVLLERIGFIWRRIGFLHKVSIRNILRYKQRMLMMIVGIAGCTALLLTGYGLRDSIENVVDFQYGEISLYEYTVSFSKGQTEKSAAAALSGCEGSLGKTQLVYNGNMDVEYGGGTKTAYIVAPASGTLDGLVDLHSGDESLDYPASGEALICTNLAEALSLNPGDSFTIRDGDMNSLALTVSGVFDNYVYNYIYISPDSFLDQWGHLPEYRTVLAKAAPGTDTADVSAQLLDCKGVSSVTSATEMMARVGRMMQSLDYIVLLIIICSGALAFIVLYDLTNINITERIREIATIKVLGFYPGETASYVFRENIVLTALGALLGLALGTALHSYVMAQIRIDMMHFETRIVPTSYLLALAFTFLFAIIVDVVMYFKLERINMAEALKSIE
jgi:putative ABC transport system permease protein